MKIAVEGCCHGELDATYNYLAEMERRNKYKIDLLIICGDFQAVRNYLDLECMSVPQKYKRDGDFSKYYMSQKRAPVPTLVIGGNHEASNYMWELYHGGWLAPNIYYLGGSGCIQVNGLRIAGASGIYSDAHYRLGHYETLPYNSSALRSAYHTREYDVLKLSLLSQPDIFLSHDWPQGVEHHGNLAGLLSRKKFFKADIQSGRLGSPPMMSLLKKLQPKRWFAAHLHVRYEASVRHGESASASAASRSANPDEIVMDDDLEDFMSQPYGSVDNPDEIVLDDADNEVDASAPAPNPDEIPVEDEPAPSTSENPDEIVLDELEPPSEPSTSARPASPQGVTQFLALDKCLPKRSFLEVVDIRTPIPVEATGPVLTFDPEWLAISKALHPFLSTSRSQLPLPSEETAKKLVDKEREWIAENVGSLDIADVQVFTMTAPAPLQQKVQRGMQPPWYTNPQTEAFARLLGVTNKVNPPPS
ncbi:DBR1-domain-containing protein [Exidia glandulosa HHB12029]|uniref:DBR1-domain-containing protein n=1 Tax=Exidia glandulosa HHB12029 TaxID=1314781 RepID=A0A165MB90_EXIGL|nr:DBR1-domain-containing protein [Exidia glandulosa HHB12029]